MDADSIWQLVDAGGALGALVVFAGYLVYQNRELSKRNNELADRQSEREIRHIESMGSIQRALERLADRLNG